MAFVSPCRVDPDSCWLNLPLEDWQNNAQFQQIENIVQDLAVTNDTSERAVKKVTDYANSASKSDPRWIKHWRMKRKNRVSFIT